jgi:hypothetical protein
MGTDVDRLREVFVPRRSVVSDHVRTYVGLSALLTVVLVVAPAGAVAFGIPVGLLLAVGAAVYALVSVALGAALEGVAVAFVFTSVFNTRAPLVVDGTELRLVSVLGVLTAALLVAANDVPEGWLRRADRRFVVGAVAAFVLWGAVAAVVGNGPDSGVAIRYVVEHCRYLAMLVLAALLVDRTGPESVLAPLTFAMGATLVFAVDEVFAGTGGYLVNFGTVGFDIARLWPSPSLTSFSRQGTVLYEVGAFGQGRTMVGLAMLFVPIVLALSLRSRRYAPVSLASLLGLVAIVASGSHAAIAGLYAGLVPVGIWAAYAAFDRLGMARARRLVVPVSLCLGALAVVAALVAAVSGPQNILFVRTNNLSVRLEQYAAAIEIAARHPLVGVGGGRNVDVVAGRGVHNLFLYHLAAVGVPGFVAYMTSVAAATGLCVWRCLSADARQRWLWVGVLGGMLGFYAYGFWTVSWRWELINAAYWLLVGVVVGADPVEFGRLRSRFRA